MPRKESAEPGSAVKAPARGAGPARVDPEGWFWDRRDWPAEPPAPGSHAPVDLTAVSAAVVGLVGLGAATMGQRHHTGGVLDLALFLLALTGTLLAVVLGGSALTRLRSAGSAARGRPAAFVGLAEAWTTVLLVLLLGAAPLAGLGH